MTNFLQGVAGLVTAACIIAILAICGNRALDHNDLYPFVVVGLLGVAAFMVGVMKKLELLVEAERKAERSK